MVKVKGNMWQGDDGVHSMNYRSFTFPSGKRAWYRRTEAGMTAQVKKAGLDAAEEAEYRALCKGGAV